jgi:glycogen operon protein
VNFATCHDGFTLHDLATYDRKHNEANGENGRDGTDANNSRNWGQEGETDATWVCRLRDRMKKNLLATLAFSQGVPMISHGDEIGRTQQGNNNAYCQDGELTWLDWALTPEQLELLRFTRTVFRIRQSNPVFRRRRFFAGGQLEQHGIKDVSWLKPDGGEVRDADWNDPESKALGMMIHGDASDDVDERGRPNLGQTLLLLLNAGNRARHFVLPALADPGSWHEIVNTAQSTHRIPKGQALNVAPHSLVLLCYEGAR